MGGSESTEREQALTDVKRNGLALSLVPERYKADRKIVLAAVQQNGDALYLAAEECKADREIVLAAVKQHGDALYLAAEECKADREIVLAAMQQNGYCLLYAADELLLDSTFAPKAKRCRYILKVSMLSGRSTATVSLGHDFAEDIIRQCRARLGFGRSGTEALVQGTEVVPATAL
eukprot:2771696-Amphidinium_carterae.1